MTQEQFTTSLMSTLDGLIAKLLEAKPKDKQNINFFDAIVLSGKLRAVFMNKIKVVPPQIEAICNITEALLAPSAEERKKRIDAVIAISGTIGGLSMIIGGIGIALGWGAGIGAIVLAFFVGTSWVLPVVLIPAGAALAAVAGYLALSGDDATKTEKYIKALKGSLQEAIPSIWVEHGEQLSQDVIVVPTDIKAQ